MPKTAFILLGACLAVFLFPKEGWMSNLGSARIESEHFVLISGQVFAEASAGAGDAKQAKAFDPNLQTIITAARPNLEYRIGRWKKEGIAFAPIAPELPQVLDVRKSGGKIGFSMDEDMFAKPPAGPFTIQFFYGDLFAQGAVRAQVAFAKMPPREKVEEMYRDILETFQTIDL